MDERYEDIFNTSPTFYFAMGKIKTIRDELEDLDNKIESESQSIYNEIDEIKEDFTLERKVVRSTFEDVTARIEYWRNEVKDLNSYIDCVDRIHYTKSTQQDVVIGELKSKLDKSSLMIKFLAVSNVISWATIIYLCVR